MKERGAVFSQSLLDFPCSVELGKSNPSFGINRWGKNALRFVPPDDEGFTLRGDKKRLVYKGRRRSHRFTVLGDNSFEYDCILLREPESNVISLKMEGAENFDFFRQPDFVKDPFLKGSYAVYKKETLIGEGTGKLCHIHRPLVIDALGRKVWGDLAVAGNELRITVPEQWLAGAKYPVVVDPVVGTSTVGSQTEYYNEEDDEYFIFDVNYETALNKFTLPETTAGQVDTFIHTKERNYFYYTVPLLYSDSGNFPYIKLSANETAYPNNFAMTTNPGGWRKSVFNINPNISGGTNVWFGMYSEGFYPSFDFGALCCKYMPAPWEPQIQDIYDCYPVEFDIKMSVYFTYTAASGQSYFRTLAQGANVTDSRKNKADYKRLQAENAPATDSRKITAEYRRTFPESVNGTAFIATVQGFFRQCAENVTHTVNLARFPVFARFVNEQAKITDTAKNNRGINRKCNDEVAVTSETKREQGFFSIVGELLGVTDKTGYPVVFVRSINETQKVTDTIRHIGGYFRGLYVEAGSLAETVRRGDFCRAESDTVKAEGKVLRHLFIFIKILTTSFVRDFIIRRFLVAREEVVIKSCLTKEIVLESKI